MSYQGDEIFEDAEAFGDMGGFPYYVPMMDFRALYPTAVWDNIPPINQDLYDITNPVTQKSPLPIACVDHQKD